MADTLELIKQLPKELREQILKEYIKIKQKEKKYQGWDKVHEKLDKGITEMKLKKRKALGWDEVHNALELAPYCHRNEQIVNVLFCSKCDNFRCQFNNLCSLCLIKETRHYLRYPAFDENDYDDCFKKRF